MHDDSMLYNGRQQRQYRGKTEEDFLVLSNNAPTHSSPTPGQAAYNFPGKSRNGQIDFVDRRPSNGHRQQYQQQGQLNTSQEQERQYYTFAKENLITFGDAPSASTGLSQEELLQRRQREEARNKKSQKKKNKIKNRLINFGSNLRRSESTQRNQFSTQQNQQRQPPQQQQPPPPSQPSNYRKIQTPESQQNIFDPNDNMPNPSGYQTGGRGTRGTMVEHHNGKFKKSSNFKSQVWNEGGETNRTGDGIRNDQIGNRLGNTYSANHDYLLVQRSPPRPGSTSGRNRPLYADFTPKSDLFKLQPYTSTKDPSPTSVMDAFSPSGGVRWNKNLTQQEVITTPQSTKLRPDSRYRTSAGKPKSILRSRYSSSMPKGQSGDDGMNFGFDDNGQRQAEGFDAGFAPDFGQDEMRGFVDNKGRDLSPIGFDRQGRDINTEFPESYVQFVQAVAAVVIQTKVRQRLAKKQVQAMRNQRYGNRGNYGYSQANTNAMVRKPYALAKKARQANQAKASRGRKDVALDFYSLAAIQIQAAFRGWWVRDCIGVDNFCATMIQKIYRGYRCRKEYHQIIDDEVTRLYGSVRIQAAMRGALVRKERAFDPMQPYHDAATKVQALWRSFVCEMTFLRAYEDILVVQSIARGWIARRRFRSLLETKSNKFSNQRKTSARFKSSRFSSSTPRNIGAPSNHSNYQNSWMAKSLAKPESSVSRPPDVKVTRPATKDSYAPWKVALNSTKGRVSNPKPNNVVETTKAETQPMNFAQEIASSMSPEDIERRRKVKEEEQKREQEKEKRRLESQAAGLAELELTRKRMAQKSAKREEKLRKEQEDKEKEIAEELKASSSDYFADVRSTQSKPSPVATTRSFESSKIEAKQSDVTETSTSPAASGGEKSAVAKAREALMASNGGGSSTPKAAPKRNFSIAKPSEKAESKKEISLPPVTLNIPANVPKRALVTESTYQKEMQKLRSESEQKRIDYFHHIFDQAGLLSRTK